MSILKNFEFTVLTLGKLFNRFLFFVLIFFELLITANAWAAQVSFNKIYKGSGSAYSKDALNIAVTNPFAGTSFKFVSKDRKADIFPSGNNIEGYLEYTDISSASHSILGTVSRQYKAGSNVHFYYFLPRDKAGAITGEAFIFIKTPYEALYPGNSTYNLSLNLSQNDLNSYLSQQSKSFVLSASSGMVSESGSTTTFDVRLESPPIGNVVLNILSDHSKESIADKNTLTFGPLNWNTHQTVTVTGLDDNLIDGNQTTIFTISVDTSGADNNFYKYPVKTYTVITSDNDVAGIILSSNSGTVTESGITETFTVALSAQPATDVVLSLVSNNILEATLDPAVIKFKPADWNRSQKVVVRGVDDDLLDGNQTAKVTIAVVDKNSDDEFTLVADKIYTVTNLDNEGPLNIMGPAWAGSHVNSIISVPENTAFVFRYVPSKAVNWEISGTDAELFLIDNDGNLTFRTAPDYEQPAGVSKDNNYFLSVSATDASNFKISQNLTITVTDLVEISPNIFGPDGDIAPAKSTASISINENNTSVYQYTADSYVAWSLSGADASLFSISSNGKLVFKLAPDFEVPADSNFDNSYTVIITAKARANLSTSQTLTIVVGDIDENFPLINGPGDTISPDGTTATHSIPENSREVHLYTSNKPVKWSLSGYYAALFTMGIDGNLVFKSAPDFEIPADSDKNNIYVVTVKAVDNSGNETIQALTVSVFDVDENAPDLMGPEGVKAPAATLASISMPENNTNVFDFKASKPVIWSIADTDAALFTISSDGKLVFKIAPDFEVPADSDKNNIYLLTIKATDNSGNETKLSLALTIIDIDDTAPYLTGPGQAIAPMSSAALVIIPENSARVFTYSASEPVTWSVSGIDAAFFTIDDDGNLGFRIHPDFENPADSDKNNSYLLTVSAKDEANNITRQALNVNVSNLNEAPLDILLSASEVYENNQLNEQIGYLKSVDNDANDTFKYSIVEGDSEAFIISNNELRANRVFDFKTNNIYNIILRTTDSGGLTLDKIFTITIVEAPKVVGYSDLPEIKKMASASNNFTISKGYGVNFNISGSSLASYDWSPAIGLSSTNTSNPRANPTKITTYTVIVTNVQRVSTALQITVNVLEDHNVLPHNVLSPDGDGVNDVWLVENLSSYPDNEIQIFDKSGQRLVHKARNYQNDWNGQFNGDLLHAGVYYYIIRFGSGTKPKVGYINLLTNR